MSALVCVLSPRRLGIAAVLAVLLCQSTVQASDVSLAGILGKKALLVVPGQAPKATGVGESHAQVRVLEVHADHAVVEHSGQRMLLHMGQPVSVGASQGSQRLVMRADARGHFITRGTVNGLPLMFMVDTGASSVAIGRSDADRLKIRYEEGEPVRISTANGVAMARRVHLKHLQLGPLEFRDVEAVITPQNMPHALLGNSLLGHVRMQRARNEMVLER